MDKSIAKRIPNFSWLKTASWSDVESVEDLHRNILSGLPVKCILPLKVISKLWHRLIRSQSFTELHLSRSRENAVYILYPFLNEVKVLHLIDADGVVTDTITLPSAENLFSMVCSYNGLICFTNYPWCPHSYEIEAVPEDLEIQICNPATREIRLLPNCSPSEKELGLGVVFGSGTSEYRVFRFFLSVRPQCEIFSSSDGTWKNIGYVKHTPMGAHHVSLNGKVYWFIASKKDHRIPGFILSVDMKNKFKIIKLPAKVNDHSYLVDLEGSLSLVVSYDDLDTVVIWLLRDGNKSDWEYKCSSGDIPYPCSAQCLDSVVARKNEVFFITQEEYYIFNTDEIVWKKLKIETWLQHNSPMVLTYTESLLPCS